MGKSRQTGSKCVPVRVGLMLHDDSESTISSELAHFLDRDRCFEYPKVIGPGLMQVI